MNKITVRVTIPFAVEFSSSPGIAGEGPTILDCRVLAKDEATALQKAQENIKVTLPRGAP
jgi:hypothetical protein